MFSNVKPISVTSLVLLVALSRSAPIFTECASVALSRLPSNGVSYQTALNRDGRYIAFLSSGTDLVFFDTNGFQDIFVRDLLTGTTKSVSVSTSGALADRASLYPAISGDGRYVAFASDATNLVDGDTNSATDVFVRDTVANTTSKVSTGEAGAQTFGFSTLPAISSNGRYVAFQSISSNIITGVSGIQIYVRDLQTGTTALASASSAGVKGNDASGNPSISADGRYVAFDSYSTNLVSGDTNGYIDVFVRDMVTGVTVRASRTSLGNQANYRSYNPSISDDAKTVVFTSEATDMVPMDFNNSPDAFAHDLLTSSTTCISVNSAGTPAGNGSAAPSVSSNGRYVAFESNSGDIPGGTDGLWKIFLRDRLTNTTQLISIAMAGATPNLESYDPWISGDGRYVGWESGASNFVSGDGNNATDVFVRGPRRPLIWP